MNSATSQDGIVTALKNQLTDKNLQIEAMYVKMDLLKKGLDDLNIKYLDSQEQLGQLSSSDFAKQNLIMKRQNVELIEELQMKTRYLEDLKSNMKLAMQGISSTRDHEQQSAIFSSVLENLSQENVKSRRIIDELQKRENLCQRKWNKLLQENLDLQQRINGHNLQMQRQREQYQLIV